MTKTLLSFGHGYSAQALEQLLLPEGWTIIGTTRGIEKADAMRQRGLTALTFPSPKIVDAVKTATHVLVSAGPNAEGDPILTQYRDVIAATAPTLEWVGYLSTTGVYGDHNSAWIDESTPLAPSTQRGQWRKAAEQAWIDIPDLPLHIFRLAGIYGPGRGPFEKVRRGTARRIIKKGQVFSRIHVDDIAQVVTASINRPNPGAVYNVCDDDPAPPQDVISYAAELLELPEPPAVAFEKAEMTPMARSFYAESKKVRNDKIKDELGVALKYSNYREGLAALLAAEGKTR